LLASPDGRDGSVKVHQDAQLYAALVDGDEKSHASACRRSQSLRARCARQREGQRPAARLGGCVKIEGEAEVVIDNGDQAEVLLFDLN